MTNASRIEVRPCGKHEKGFPVGRRTRKLFVSAESDESDNVFYDFPGAFIDAVRMAHACGGCNVTISGFVLAPEPESQQYEGAGMKLYEGNTQIGSGVPK